jgi:large subunit ribosomal protein L18
MRSKIRNPKRGGWLARRERVRRSIERSTHPRLTIYRTSRHMYAQIVDPVSGHTLATVSTRSKELAAGLEATGNLEGARRVGKAIAELARQKQIEEVVFNRNGFLYHGRVKAVADAAREAGLKF